MIGWSIATHLRTELVVAALQMAMHKPDPGLMHHSDRGVQYTSLSCGKRLETKGLVDETGRLSAYGNALAEWFVATLKTELLYRASWPTTRQTARTAIFEYIEDFYNSRRRHFTLGYLSPAEFEEVKLTEAAT